MAEDDRPEQIRRRAHELWEQAGSPEGRETEFWLQAERGLTENLGGPPQQEQPPKR